MGEYCQNLLVLNGPAPEVNKFRMRAQTSEKNVLEPQRFNPYPSIGEWTSEFKRVLENIRERVGSCYGESVVQDLIKNRSNVNNDNVIKQIIEYSFLDWDESLKHPDFKGLDDWASLFDLTIREPWVKANWGAFLCPAKRIDGAYDNGADDNTSTAYVFTSYPTEPPINLISSMASRFTRVSFDLMYFKVNQKHGKMTFREGRPQLNQNGEYFGPAINISMLENLCRQSCRKQ